jgi:hypothetical protein
MTEYNLPEPDDMPWVLGLTQEEVQKLREDKQRLSEYARKRIKELLKKIPENDEIEDILNVKLTEEKKQELDEMRLIDRYNQYYNDACAGLPYGTTIAPEHMQSLALKSAIYAFSRKYNMKDSIPVSDLKNLADLLENQGNEYLERVRQSWGPKE